MKNSLFKVISAGICAIFLGALVYLFVSLNSAYNLGYESAKVRFDKLSSQTAGLISNSTEVDKTFLDQFNKAVGAPDIYNYVELRKGDIVIYRFPAEGKLTNPKFAYSQSTTISTENSASYTLTASIYALSSSVIYSKAKIAFLIILAGTVFCLIYLVYLYVSKTQEESSSKPKSDFVLDDDFYKVDITENNSFTSDTAKTSESESFGKSQDLEESEKIDDKEEFYVPEEEPVTFNEPVLSEQSSQENLNEQDEEFDIPETDSILEEKSAAEVSQSNPIDEPEPKPEEPSASTEGSKGLFSNETGVCYQDYLETRLDSELVRSASSEQDVSLILFKIPGLDLKSQCAVDIAIFLLGVFQFKDMIFEYNNEGFAVIIQNKDIEKTMATSEEIYTEICGILNKHGMAAKLYIGISSRSLRLISAQRIIMEADQALIHAADDAESPIIAFRVNPEKYRKYIAGIED
ncbi:MAG: hypothetical protein MJ169_06870 [Treponema sp.]|nr:hypothetical protein [Treponema sp.]